MGFWSNIFGRNTHIDAPPSSSSAERSAIAVGSEDTADSVMTFNNKNITYGGELADFDYDKV